MAMPQPGVSKHLSGVARADGCTCGASIHLFTGPASDPAGLTRRQSGTRQAAQFLERLELRLKAQQGAV